MESAAVSDVPPFCGKVLRARWVRKQGRVLPSWKRRVLVLGLDASRGFLLAYYGPGERRARGEVHVGRRTLIRPSLRSETAFEVRISRPGESVGTLLVVDGGSPGERDAWMESIRSCVAACSAPAPGEGVRSRPSVWGGGQLPRSDKRASVWVEALRATALRCEAGVGEPYVRVSLLLGSAGGHAAPALALDHVVMQDGVLGLRMAETHPGSALQRVGRTRLPREGAQSPQWGDRVRVGPLWTQSDRFLCIDVLDEAHGGPRAPTAQDSLIGRAIVPLSTLPLSSQSASHTPHWIRLANRHGKAKDAGALLARVWIEGAKVGGGGEGGGEGGEGEAGKVGKEGKEEEEGVEEGVRGLEGLLEEFGVEFEEEKDLIPRTLLETEKVFDGATVLFRPYLEVDAGLCPGKLLLTSYRLLFVGDSFLPTSSTSTSTPTSPLSPRFSIFLGHVEDVALMIPDLGEKKKGGLGQRIFARMQAVRKSEEQRLEEASGTTRRRSMVRRSSQPSTHMPFSTAGLPVLRVTASHGRMPRFVICGPISEPTAAQPDTWGPRALCQRLVSRLRYVHQIRGEEKALLMVYPPGSEESGEGDGEGQRRSCGVRGELGVFWRECSVNKEYGMCGSYPRTIVVPSDIDDAMVQRVGEFRSKGRIPAMVWRHPKTHAVLTRSSQPLVGLRGARCEPDERMLTAIRTATPNPKPYLAIVDCRPRINAMAQQAIAAGFERTGPGNPYSDCRITFCNIGNIHVMRQSLETLVSALHLQPNSIIVRPPSFHILSNIPTPPPSPFHARWKRIGELVASGSAKVLEEVAPASTSPDDSSRLRTPPPRPKANKRRIGSISGGSGLGGAEDSSDEVDTDESSTDSDDSSTDSDDSSGSTTPSAPMPAPASDSPATETGSGEPEGGGKAVDIFKVIEVGGDDSFGTVSAASKWTVHLSRVLAAAVRIVRLLDHGGVSVLLHCSDGWDRTTQVSCLAQVMLDPHARTVDGFLSLIQREWLSFGHKFRDRCGRGGVPPSHGGTGVFGISVGDTTLSTRRRGETAVEEKPPPSLGGDDDADDDDSTPPPLTTFKSAPASTSTSAETSTTAPESSPTGKRKELGSHESSPVFLQWLDCVWQIYRQFPHAFAFSESLLFLLARHVNSKLFVEFLYNSERERSLLNRRAASLFDLIRANPTPFLSTTPPSPPSSPWSRTQVLIPQISPRALYIFPPYTHWTDELHKFFELHEAFAVPTL